MARKELGRMVGALDQPRRVKLLAMENLRKSLDIAGSVSKYVTPKSAWAAVSAAVELEEEDEVSLAPLVLLCYFRRFFYNLYEEVIFIAESILPTDEGARAREVLRLTRVISDRAEEHEKKEEEIRRIVAEANASWAAAVADVCIRTRKK
jgi:hypothetical protein